MSIKRIAPVAFLVVLVGIGAYLLIKQRVTSEEARIRSLMGDIEQAFESRKLGKCLAVAADDYKDNFGHNTKDELESDLRLLFQFASDVDVRLEDVDINIRGNEADIALTATATAQTKFGDLSLNHEVGHTRFELLIRKDRGRWKVVRAAGVDDYR
jgi:hypothetical protein